MVICYHGGCPAWSFVTTALQFHLQLSIGRTAIQTLSENLETTNRVDERYELVLNGILLSSVRTKQIIFADERYVLILNGTLFLLVRTKPILFAHER